MRILMLKDYYYPEKCAGINLAEDLVQGFAKYGNCVEVYTPIPCRGIDESLRRKYRKKKKEEKGTICIYRYWLPYEKTGVLSRAARYVLQNIIQIHKGVWSKYDVLLLGSTPPTMGLVGSILKKIKRKPFIYNLQDIFPDSLVIGNIVKKDSFIYKIGQWIEKISYKNADHIIVISEGFKENLLNKGVSEKKITVVNNWIDTDKIVPIARKKNSLFDEFQISRNKFIVVYAGNFGASQGCGVILEAAKLLIGESDIEFVIFGGGAEYGAIKKRIIDEKISNIKTHDLLPLERVAEVYSMGDVALITCKSGAGRTGMPSKTWSIMACNTPIIAAFDKSSDLSEILKAAHCGSCVEPENVVELCGAIFNEYLYWKENGKRDIDSQSFVRENADKDYCVQRYLEIIQKSAMG